jgi:hypothetical protein
MKLALEVAELPSYALSGVKRLANRALVGDLTSVLADEATLAAHTATRKEVATLLAGFPKANPAR